MRMRQDGPQRLLVQFSVNTPDQDTLMWGGESIYCGEELVGSITSAGYDHSADQPIGLGFVSRAQGGRPLTREEIDSWGAMEIEINGDRHPAKIISYPGLK